MEKNTSNARAVAIFDQRDNLIGLEGRSGKSWKVGQTSIAARLMAARSRARGFNWIEGGVMPAPPVVSVEAIGFALPAGMTAMADNRFSASRAKLRVRGSGGPAFEENFVASNYYRARGVRTDAVGGFALGQSSWEVTIATDSRYVAFELLGTATRAYSVYVRDLVGNNSGLTAANGHNIGAANATLILDFGTAGDREVTLLLEHALHGVRAFAVEASASIYPRAQDELPVLFASDSYGLGTISPQPNYVGRTVPDVVRALLGCDVVQQSIGASGFIANNNFNNAYRLEDAAAINAPLSLVFLGTNDTATTGVQLQLAVERALGGMRDKGVTGKVIFGGPWPQNRMSAGVSAGKTATLQIEQDIANALARMGDPGAVFLPINTAGMATPWGGVCTPWVTGTQSTSAAGGDAGNSRRVTGDDNAHPSLYGALNLGRRIVNEVVATCVHQGW